MNKIVIFVFSVNIKVEVCARLGCQQVSIEETKNKENRYYYCDILPGAFSLEKELHRFSRQYIPHSSSNILNYRQTLIGWRTCSWYYIRRHQVERRGLMHCNYQICMVLEQKIKEGSTRSGYHSMKTIA